jgi:FkbM family methyltransferase
MPASIKGSLYTNPTLSGILRSSLNFVMPEGLTTVTVSSGRFIGLRMKLELQSEKDYWLATYEPELQAAIYDLTQPGQIIFDLGANIGFISLLFADRVGSNGHVYAFEALPDNVTRLQQNVDLNEFQDRVTVIQTAVLDRSRQANFLVGPSHGTGKVEGAIGRTTLKYGSSIQVPGISIDEFVYQCENPVPDIIKIDIEGGEIFALLGMQQLLNEHNPIVFLELHGPEAARKSWELLSEKKYRICEMTQNYDQVFDVADLDWKSYLVAFPDGYGEPSFSR